MSLLQRKTMELKDIKELINLVGASDISEIELETEGVKLRIAKQGVGVPAQTQSTPMPAAVVPPPANEVVAEQSTPPSSEQPNTIDILSPMVGTFYRAPSPTSDPFVEEGDVVKQGQGICIIEAMKIMNEIEAENSGRLIKVLVENGQPVEYGQPLFRLEPVE